MSDVIAGALAKVKARVPDQIGLNSRWTESHVTNIIIAADRATRDLCEVHRLELPIVLTDDTISYGILSGFVSIDKVEFSLDGTNYDWLLQSRSLGDLDGISHSWRTDRSSRPDFYSLLSAPGVQSEDGLPANSPSQIVLYPGLATPSGARIKITGTYCPIPGTYASGLVMEPEDVQSKCIVPFVLSVLYATADSNRSAEEYQKFKDGCEDVRNRFRSQYKNFPSR